MASKKVIILLGFLFILSLIIAALWFVLKDKLTSPKPASIQIQPQPSPQVNNYQELLEGNIIKPIGQILEINFSYDIKRSPVLTLDGIVKKNGYPPLASNEKGDYTLIVWDKSERVIYQTKFNIPNQLVNPPPLPGEEEKLEPVVELQSVKFTLTIPYLPKGSSLQILDSQNQSIQNQSLEIDIPQIDNQPDFKSIPGREFLPPKQTLLNEILDFLIPPSYAAPDGFLNIVIISQGYTDFNQFHNDINEIMAHALTYEPFKKRASQILVSYIDNSSDLGCVRHPNSAFLLYCDNQLVTQRVNTAGVPYDNIHVLINDPNYGGSGGTITAGYNGLYKGETLVHEVFGHSFGGLLDEYSLYGDGNLDNQIHGLYDNIGNCYAGLPPVPSWNSLVNSQDYTKGCNYNNWYRSSASSIMKTLADKYFNPVSQAILNQRLDTVAGIPPAPGSFNFNGALVPFCQGPNDSRITIRWWPSQGATSYTITPQTTNTSKGANGWLPAINVGDPPLQSGGYKEYIYQIPETVVSGESWEFTLIASNGINTTPVVGGSSYYVMGWTTAQQCPNPSPSASSPTPSPQEPALSPSPSSLLSPSPTIQPSVSKKPGDTDEDSDIDIFDYNRVIQYFGRTNMTDPEVKKTDLNSNNEIDIFDYNLVVSNFGN